MVEREEESRGWGRETDRQRKEGEWGRVAGERREGSGRRESKWQKVEEGRRERSGRKQTSEVKGRDILLEHLDMLSLLSTLPALTFIFFPSSTVSSSPSSQPVASPLSAASSHVCSLSRRERAASTSPWKERT